MSPSLEDLTKRTVAYAIEKGAREAMCGARRGRSIRLQYRDGQLDRMRESATASIWVELYVDGRYSRNSTSDLRWRAVQEFIDQAIEITRVLGEDPFRALPDPSLYKGRSEANLDLFDPSCDKLDTPSRQSLAAAVADAARSADGPIVSSSGSWSDNRSESFQFRSNGFEGHSLVTSFSISAGVTVEDSDGRRPQDWDFAAARHIEDLPEPRTIGENAARKALSRRGQRKLPSGTMTVVVDPQSAGRLLRYFLPAMTGSALYRRRSFLLDRVDKQVGSHNLTLIDDPLIVRGLGSRLFDGDGIAAHPRVLIERGVLRSYFIAVYHGRKLDMAPTGGGTSNLFIAPGARDRDAIIASIEKGVLVTGFIGGGSDSTAGDFSIGIAGFEIEGGELGAPVGEMNIGGNHKTFWNKLIEVGSDPFPYSSSRVPTLVFEDVAVSGV